MGLKAQVEQALGKQTPRPVRISGDAHRMYATLIRRWSGWNDAVLRFGDPSPVSPYASCDVLRHEFVANADRLTLNPNRVLNSITPFRLRQEAVLTGALLHEAGHARHTRWLPGAGVEVFHTDGTRIEKTTADLAILLEEPRVESRIMSEVERIGAPGLGWTMRASATALLPLTDMSTDPNQAVMDVYRSYVLRAGRQRGIHQVLPNYVLPAWVSKFEVMLHEVLVLHLTDQGVANPVADALAIANITDTVIIFTLDDDTKFMVDSARDILRLMFPNGQGEGGGVSVGGACGSAGGSAPMPSQAGSEAGGEQDESDEQAEGEGQDGEDQAEGSGSVSGNDDLADLDYVEKSDALAQMEQQSKSETMKAGDEQTKAGDTPGGSAGGVGSGLKPAGGGYRHPEPSERDVAKKAERFLRDMIEPTTSSKITLDSSPSATVDGAALSAWRAGGSVREPHFFKRVHRATEPAPPIKIAILVDVSSSMDELQAPSALLSWALSSACLDLRNFAGRGVQIESTLIHWGDVAEVVVPNGKAMPGIREVRCAQGTSAMHKALMLAEQEIPGIFEESDPPANRLVVQFTDWRLSSMGLRETTEMVAKVLGSGANMLSVVPQSYAPHYSSLKQINADVTRKRGVHSIMVYDQNNPTQVWDQAAKSLAPIEQNGR